MITNRPVRLVLWVVLALSLLLNAVTLGVVWRVNDIRRSLTGNTAGLSGLPAGVRADLARAVFDRPPQITAAIANLGAARRLMFEASAARPFDRAALEATLKSVREATTALQVEGQLLLLEIIARHAAAEGGA